MFIVALANYILLSNDSVYENLRLEAVLTLRAPLYIKGDLVFGAGGKLHGDGDFSVEAAGSISGLHLLLKFDST